MRKMLGAALLALATVGAGAAPVSAAHADPARSFGNTAESTPVTKVVQDAVDSTTRRLGPVLHPEITGVDFAGTVSLSNCSGSVVRFPGSQDDDPALVMSNGHCLETGMPGPGEVVVDQPSSRSFGLLDASGNQVATLRADAIVYGTMTDTDVSIYRLTTTYAQIKSSYGIDALTVADTHPTAGTAITVASGYWKRLYSCDIDGFVYNLKEGDWTFKDSVRYTSACDTVGGTSGSPVIDQAINQVVAVNNTGNEDGQRCTVNNPCEVDENGAVTVHQGVNYAQQTYQIPACFGVGNKLDLNASGCVLPKP